MVSGHRATRKRHCHPGKLGHSASPVGSFASSSLFPFPSPCPKELLLGYNDMKITLLRTCLLIILFTLLRLLFLLLVSLVFLLLLLLLGDGNLPGPVVHVQPQQLPHVVYGLLAVLEPQLSPLLSLLINSYSFSKTQLQGCIFCWKKVTEGHLLKILCGRYKEGIVEGIRKLLGKLLPTATFLKSAA